MEEEVKELELKQKIKPIIFIPKIMVDIDLGDRFDILIKARDAFNNTNHEFIIDNYSNGICYYIHSEVLEHFKIKSDDYKLLKENNPGHPIKMICKIEYYFPILLEREYLKAQYLDEEHKFFWDRKVSQKTYESRRNAFRLLIEYQKYI
jgi:hypothetical protein